MIILVDVDDVLTNFVGDWLKSAKVFLPFQSITDWNINSFCSSEEAGRLLKQLENTGLYRSLIPYEKVVESLKRLRETNEVFLVTACPIRHAAVRESWVAKHFPFISTKNIIFARTKWLLKGDVIIDDCWDHIDKSICEKKILISKPWNMKFHPEARRRGILIRDSFVDAVDFL